MKTLTDDTVITNARFFGNGTTQVPKSALTVGVGTITDAREVLIVANGHGKARAVAHCIEEGVNHMWTLSVSQMHGKATIVIDDAGTDELRVKTVKFFKSLQDAYEKELFH